MKRFIAVLAILSLIISVNHAFAETEKISNSALSAKTALVTPCKQGNNEMMIQCPMLKKQAAIKDLLKTILQLQQRGLTASAKEKLKIKKDIEELIKKIDAMPERMDCPMMNMKQDVSSDKKTPPEEQSKEEVKSSEHKH